MKRYLRWAGIAIGSILGLVIISAVVLMLVGGSGFRALLRTPTLQPEWRGRLQRKSRRLRGLSTDWSTESHALQSYHHGIGKGVIDHGQVQVVVTVVELKPLCLKL